MDDCLGISGVPLRGHDHHADAVGWRCTSFSVNLAYLVAHERRTQHLLLGGHRYREIYVQGCIERLYRGP